MPRRTQPHLLRASFRPDAEIDESAYPFNIPAVAEIGLIDFHPNVTFFVGENGSGKSTVLEALAVAMGFGAEGGTKSVRLQTTNDQPAISPLHASLRLARVAPIPRDGYFLRAESFFNVATYMDGLPGPSGYGDRRLHGQSHGESFMAVLSKRPANPALR